MPSSVGLVGLGLVGRALAERMRGAGFRVLGYDRDPAARERFAGACGSLEEVCAGAERLVLAVFDTDGVEQVVDAAPAVRLFIDCTTGDPRRIEGLAGRVAQRGARFVECPLSGSSEAIRRGEALALVAGDASGAQDLLAAISPRRVHVGQPGMGARAKLATNLVLGLHRAAVAEGMALAEALGIERSLFLELFRAAPIAAATVAKAERMASRQYSPESRVRQHLKDVQLMLAQAAEARQALPLSETHERLLREAVAAGDGDLDNAAIIRRWRTA